uniref:(2,3-dihydroxybenzoyl)adenylate synthase n=1 Tax=Endozoicomonas sp. Mp262 TaxID=2919499 RepID=UPI00351BA124
MTGSIQSKLDSIAQASPGWPEDIVSQYQEQGYWENISFGQLLRQRAERFQDKTAIVCGNRRWSYHDLDVKADQLAAGFQRIGITEGDIVVVQLPNIAEFFAVCFALFRLGVLPVMALPAHRRAEISYFCQFTEAKAYIIADQFAGFDYRGLAREVKKDAPALDHIIVVGDADEFIPLSSLYDSVVPLPDLNPSCVAFFQLSGGSTGVPKLIPRTHNDYIYSLRVSAEVCGLDKDSVYLCALPAAHNFPLSSPGTLGTFYAGGHVVMAPNPAPDQVFPLIDREKVTVTGVVPPLALVWMEAAGNADRGSCYDLSSLQVLQVGGAKFSAEAAKRVEPVLGCKLQQVFGMAEGLVNYTRLDDPEDIIVNTQGRPCSPADEVKVVDDDDVEVTLGETGHLLTRGPYTIRGYFKAAEHNSRSFTTDGFYRTGDIVRLTEQGYLVVEGRDKDQINRGGEKIAAEEVENHLLAHPAVHDAAIVAMPDPYLGERSCAFIIPQKERPKIIEIKRFLANCGLAQFKVPDRIIFVDAFPKTSIGKVSKKSLRVQV